MKVVINACFGGFSLSPAGIKRWAELKGRACYFFRTARGAAGNFDLHRHESITQAQAEADGLFWDAFDIPNPDEVLTQPENWGALSDAEKKAHDELYGQHSLWGSDIPRDDPDLIRVVEELGGEHRTGASGSCAKLRIVEIPDGTDYEISEYDGREHIAEKHRTWP